MGAQAELFGWLAFVGALHGGHEGNESHEKGVCKTCKAPCVCWQSCENSVRPEKIGSREEQSWEDCQQEKQCTWQGQPVDRSMQGCPCSLEDQRFCCHQKRFSPLQQS